MRLGSATMRGIMNISTAIRPTFSHWATASLRRSASSHSGKARRRLRSTVLWTLVSGPSSFSTDPPKSEAASMGA